MLRSILALIMLCQVVGPSTSMGSQVAVRIDPALATESGWPGRGTINGWEFVPTTDIVVTHLGRFDNAPNGLKHAEWIGIFSLDKTLLTLAWLRTGTQEPLLDYFRYVEITPLKLWQDQHYVIAAGSDIMAGAGNHMLLNFRSPPQFASEIEYVQSRFGSSLSPDGIGFPSRLPYGDEYPYRFGPSLQFTVVPEPSAYALGALALLSLIAFRRSFNR